MFTVNFMSLHIQHNKYLNNTQIINTAIHTVTFFYSLEVASLFSF